MLIDKNTSKKDLLRLSIVVSLILGEPCVVKSKEIILEEEMIKELCNSCDCCSL